MEQKCPYPYGSEEYYTWWEKEHAIAIAIALSKLHQQKIKHNFGKERICEICGVLRKDANNYCKGNK